MKDFLKVVEGAAVVGAVYFGGLCLAVGTIVEEKPVKALAYGLGTVCGLGAVANIAGDFVDMVDIERKKF